MSTVKSTVTSQDGTTIAYDRTGAGPPVVLVGGGLDDGVENAPLAAELAAEFTVFNYARRGRGASGDTPPYAVRREVEDLDALIAVAGGPVHLFGASSGGALALEAAAAGLSVATVAVYEVPYPIGDDEVSAWRAYRTNLATASPGDALELFMRLAGSSDEDIVGARAAPVWADLERLAPTLPYDAACLGDGPPPRRLADVEQPVLVLTGDAGLPGLALGYFDRAAEALDDLLPNADRLTVPGQGHVADPKTLAPVLSRFFTG
ncbi:MAG TPA: alpha/beta hydrolase [Actinophytocola sp.]|nr:alpha/beta hydrolase [Actinophytocola sp.]